MNYPIVLLLSAGAGLCVSILTAAGVVWKTGSMTGRINQTLEAVQEEVRLLRETKEEHIEIIARVVAQLDSLEGRVSRGGF